jgi:hypothetical protein
LKHARVRLQELGTDDPVAGVRNVRISRIVARKALVGCGGFCVLFLPEGGVREPQLGETRVTRVAEVAAYFGEQPGGDLPVLVEVGCDGFVVRASS